MPLSSRLTLILFYIKSRRKSRVESAKQVYKVPWQYFSIEGHESLMEEM